MRHAFTIDVEDYYHGSTSLRARLSSPPRLDYSLNLLLDLLAEYQVKATFFWLGIAAKQHPKLVERVVNLEHEIACHGWNHERVNLMSRDRFTRETRYAKGLLSDISGQEIRGYRAPYFSIRSASWALPELVKLGFVYDSSLFSSFFKDNQVNAFFKQLQFVDCTDLIEVPLVVRRVLEQDLPVVGGIYTRVYPYSLLHRSFLNAQNQQRSLILYCHPWELDQHTPQVPLSLREIITNSINRSSFEFKLRGLLTNFKFTSIAEILNQKRFDRYQSNGIA
jgi:polysaccharide deacetylase family protein (PEP-CTERM system associated)